MCSRREVVLARVQAKMNELSIFLLSWRKIFLAFRRVARGSGLKFWLPAGPQTQDSRLTLPGSSKTQDSPPRSGSRLKTQDSCWGVILVIWFIGHGLLPSWHKAYASTFILGRFTYTLQTTVQLYSCRSDTHSHRHTADVMVKVPGLISLAQWHVLKTDF